MTFSEISSEKNRSDVDVAAAGRRLHDFCVAKKVLVVVLGFMAAAAALVANILNMVGLRV